MLGAFEGPPRCGGRVCVCSGGAGAVYIGGGCEDDGHFYLAVASRALVGRGREGERGSVGSVPASSPCGHERVLNRSTAADLRSICERATRLDAPRRPGPARLAPTTTRRPRAPAALHRVHLLHVRHAAPTRHSPRSSRPAAPRPHLPLALDRRLQPEQARSTATEAL